MVKERLEIAGNTRREVFLEHRADASLSFAFAVTGQTGK